FWKIGLRCFRGLSRYFRMNSSVCYVFLVALRRTSPEKPWLFSKKPSRYSMGKTTGFLEHSRELAPRRPVTQRVNDWFEIYLDLPEEKLRSQGARCMDCGVPFC